MPLEKTMSVSLKEMGNDYVRLRWYAVGRVCQGCIHMPNIAQCTNSGYSHLLVDQWDHLKQLVSTNQPTLTPFNVDLLESPLATFI